MMKYALELLTVCQGVWVLTLMSFIVWHYVHKSIKNRILEKNALFMGISYCCLTMASMISSVKGFYAPISLWQILVIIAYTLGDIVIVRMLFHIQKAKSTVNIVKKEIERLRKEDEENQKKKQKPK